MTEPYKPRIFISCAHADEPERPAGGEIRAARGLFDLLSERYPKR